MSEEPGVAASAEKQTVVWDPFVRIFHWGLVVAFTVAYFTGDESEALHVWSGYVVGGLVLARIVWGFVGPKHARFADFVTAPFTAWRYMFGLIRFRSRRYVGHSPAGGWMVVALMLSCGVMVGSGMVWQADTDGTGPVAWLQGGDAVVDGDATAVEQATASADRRGRRRRSVWHEVHEIAVNLGLLLVVFHLGGVILASIAHRENLVRAMFTGRKRAQ